MNDQFFYMIWPERRTVTAKQILGWYADALANEELEGEPTQNAEEAARALDEAGLITLTKRSLA